MLWLHGRVAAQRSAQENGRYHSAHRANPSAYPPHDDTNLPDHQHPETPALCCAMMRGSLPPGRSGAMLGLDYYTMQVCLSGHCINGSYYHDPHQNPAFCPDCGEPTITACQECKAPIKGDFAGVPTFSKRPVPAFCDACGLAYPWQVSRAANAIELLRLEGVEEAVVQEIEKNLPDVTRNTPRTQVAVLRIRKVLLQAGKPIYDVGVKVVGDIAAAAARSYLGV